jgi:class 3 adenylate cyclase/tetratricopeptide (TPR) repeat protein
MTACPACGEQSPERARFCWACGTTLSERPLTDEIRKSVTVVFCDVAGSTALGERLDPEALRSVMSRYYERVRQVVERHGGTVAKFIGDAVLAVFGVPTLHEDDPVRAVRAAAEIPAVIQALNADIAQGWGVTIGVKIGVNTGQIVAARDPLVAEMVLGDPVNVAARLEQAAESGQILLGSPTYQLVQDPVEVRPLTPLALKGKQLPVPAWQLLKVTSGAPGHLRRMDSPMVGRTDELELLRHAFRRAVREQRCCLFTLLGPAGVGKSRLISEFLADVVHESTILSGHCPSYGKGITFWPVAEVVKQAIGLLDDDTPEAAFEKLHGLWREEEQAAIIKPLAGLLGLADSTALADELPYALRRLFESLARRRPLIVVFDDLQWAESTFLDLIEYLADWFRDGPLLLVGVARPEFVDAHPTWAGGKVNATSILLESLNVQDTSLLATNLASGQLPVQVHARITQAAAGVPLFVEEFLRMLIDDGSITRVDDGWVATRDLAGIPVPASIHALLAARLELLDERDRAILQRASVVGPVFDQDDVVELFPQAERQLISARLMALVHTELIAPDRGSFAKKDTFRFRHDLIRDAAYESLPKQQRAELHERLAAWIEHRRGARHSEDEGILGYHLERAHYLLADLGALDDHAFDLAQAAATQLGAAARKAFHRADGSTASNLFRRAAALLPPSDPALPALKAEFGTAIAETGAFLEAHRLLGEVAATASDKRLARRATVERIWVGMQIHTEDVVLDQVRAQAEESIAVLTELGDDLGLAMSWRLVAEAEFLDTVFGKVTEAAEQSLQHARRASDPHAEGWALYYVVMALDLGPTPVTEAIERCQALYAESIGRRWHARTLGAVAHLEAKQRRFTVARQLIRQARAIAEELPGNPLNPWLDWWSGLVERLAGDMAAAEREIRLACDGDREIGDKSSLSVMTLALAEVLISQGRGSEALRLIEEGQAAAASEDVWAQAAWRSTQAKVLTRGHKVDEAEQLAREAVQLASRTDFLELHADALLVLAEVLQAGSHSEPTMPLLNQAARLYRQKGNLAALARLEARLDQHGVDH